MLLSSAHSIRSYPAIGEPFEIVFYGDYKGNQPLAIARRVGHCDGWEHDGPLIEGRVIRLLRLVALKSALAFDELRAELVRQYGKVPEGQWVSGFKATFPKTDGKGPIGIADASWVAPDGHFNFLCVGRGGDMEFHRASGAFGPGWRWIV